MFIFAFTQIEQQLFLCTVLYITPDDVKNEIDSFLWICEKQDK